MDPADPILAKTQIILQNFGLLAFLKFFTLCFYSRRCSIRKRVLKSFEHFTEKHLCWSFFLIKLEAFKLVV